MTSIPTPSRNGLFASPKQVQAHLQRLRDKEHLTWTEIALRPVFCDIPVGTLHDIYHTGKVPRKWRPTLGLKGRPRVAIHKEDMNSAANTIVNNLSREKIVKLCELLDRHLTRIDG